jgi:hypothetical protein
MSIINNLEKELDISAKEIMDSIVEISNAMQKLNNTRLKREAIVTLIHDKSGIAKKTINIVLDNLEQLEDSWLKPIKK